MTPTQKITAPNWGELVRSKTFWAGIISILGGIQGFFTGEPDTSTSISMIINGFMFIFLRHGILKGGAV